MNNSNYLLDTSVLLQLKIEPEKITHSEVEKLTGTRPNVSATTVREVHELVRKRTISLVERTDDFVDRLLEGCEIIPIDRKIAAEAVELPEYKLDGDLTDREIIATARIRKLTILTLDKEIYKYEWVKSVNVG